MAEIDPTAARRLAVDIVKRLKESGYEALWAGGCVRDQLTGRTPKDYDVATSARPSEVRRLFGHKRTLAIGASFGVITVLGPRTAGQVEVATFREDDSYSDGRRPDRVTYSNAENDAQRRDFTINGLFFDPLTDQVIDYVGGEEDLERGVIRAIGDPRERIDEDKLRMLRAVRFAADFQFQIEQATRQAVTDHAHEIHVVSGERIAAEMRRMLKHNQRAKAVTLMMETGLLFEILPESQRLSSDNDRRQTTVRVLSDLTNASFETALAALMSQLDLDSEQIELACRRWRLANQEMQTTVWILRNQSIIRDAIHQPWPIVQRLLVHPAAEQVVQLAQSLVRILDQKTDSIEFCLQRLAWPADQLNPAPLINGDLLQQAGLKPGPQFRKILTQVRDAQLNGHITSRSEAIELARQLWSS